MHLQYLGIPQMFDFEPSISRICMETDFLQRLSIEHAKIEKEEYILLTVGLLTFAEWKKIYHRFRILFVWKPKLKGIGFRAKYILNGKVWLRIFAFLFKFPLSILLCKCSIKVKCKFSLLTWGVSGMYHILSNKLE